MKKIVAILIVVFAAAGYCFAADLTVRSEKQEFKDEQHKIFLSGDVKVKMDDINVSSPRAEVDLDPQTKEIKTVTFLDDAYSYQVKGNKKQEIKANIIKMSLLDKVLTAEGNAQSSVTEKQKPVIVITADKQEYNNKTNIVNANGSVIVFYKDFESFSNTASVDLTKKNEIKRIQIMGSASVKQKNNKITAHKIVYDTEREQALATGSVFSDVNMEDGTALKVNSNFQMYDKKANTLVASGNAVIRYQDYTARGPKASVFPDKTTNKLNEVIFLGRSKIEQQGRTIEADRIRMTMHPKDFDAQGNVVTFIPNVQSVEK